VRTQNLVGSLLSTLARGRCLVKSEPVQRLVERNPHLYQRDVENIVDAILDEITNALARFDRVELRGFGVFSTRERRERTGRNPRTGDNILVTEKRLPAFRTGRKCANCSIDVEIQPVQRAIMSVSNSANHPRTVWR
jgi:integration host factor subunit beta